jgi:hypothetical protein
VIVVCETVAAITLHLRDATEVPPKYGGHPHPKPQAFCGSDIAWDTHITLDGFLKDPKGTCRFCRTLYAARSVSP